MTTQLRRLLLDEILSQPSAPFRERHVISTVIKALIEAGVPHFSDPVGNIVIGAANQKEYLRKVRQKTREPLRVFIAHMDHPGFHGIHWKSECELEVKWFGGSPTQHIEGAKVWLANANGWAGSGEITSVRMLPSGKAIESAVVRVIMEVRARNPQASELYGGFGFRAPVWQEGNLLYTKAADDLVGSFAIVSLALDFWGGKSGTGKKKRAFSVDLPVLGILTRAEEEGFIGAIGHFELGWLSKPSRPILCISLETSRTLPGAEVGKGPVVRLGDRYTVFDPGSLRIFSDLAAKALPEKHQRRVMDGGTCEGTAATVYGFSCVGISVPLGNYHNQNFEGGPDSRGPLGPAPEFVHLQDVQGLLELCRALMTPKQPWMKPWEIRRKEFKKNLREYQPLLRSGP